MEGVNKNEEIKKDENKQEGVKWNWEKIISPEGEVTIYLDDGYGSTKLVTTRKEWLKMLLSNLDDHTLITPKGASSMSGVEEFKKFIEEVPIYS